MRNEVSHDGRGVGKAVRLLSCLIVIYEVLDKASTDSMLPRFEVSYSEP